jgi:hypothetical protein
VIYRLVRIIVRVGRDALASCLVTICHEPDAGEKRLLELAVARYRQLAGPAAELAGVDLWPRRANSRRRAG